MLELNKIYQCDCLDLMPLITDKSIDMILCDLPYGTTACKWDTIIPFEPLWTQYKRIIKDNGAIVLTASQPFTTDLINSNRGWFKYEWIWVKNRPIGFFNCKYMPLKTTEDILIFGNGRINYTPIRVKRTEKEFKDFYRKNDSASWGDNVYATNIKVMKRQPESEQRFKYPTNIISIKKEDKRNGTMHPTQKPVALFEYLIKTYTNEGDLVLDNCIGSGTTAIACMQTNRNFIGMELEPKYVETANKRIQDFKQQLILV